MDFVCQINFFLYIYLEDDDVFSCNKDLGKEILLQN